MIDFNDKMDTFAEFIHIFNQDWLILLSKWRYFRFIFGK